MKTVKDIGEQGLLSKLIPFCDHHQIGDDGAVVKLNSNQSLVVTTDMLVDGVHFSDRTTLPEDAGWRAAAANLSDLAAMGATPIGITVGLSLRGDVPVTWVEKLYEGMSQCLEKYNTSIIGGDICRSPVITVAITAFGQVAPRQLISRYSAQPGDVILITGYHGLSRAGLELLLHPETVENLIDTERQLLIKSHQKPLPRLDVLEHLSQVRGNHHVAGMDSSDGLADAIIQICRCSGVGAQIERHALPLSTALMRGFPEKALEWTLYGGEDFELILCLSPNIADQLLEKLGSTAAIIGKISKTTEVELIDSTGLYPTIPLNLSQGFQHFQ